MTSTPVVPQRAGGGATGLPDTRSSRRDKRPADRRPRDSTTEDDGGQRGAPMSADHKATRVKTAPLEPTSSCHHRCSQIAPFGPHAKDTQLSGHHPRPVSQRDRATSDDPSRGRASCQLPGMTQFAGILHVAIAGRVVPRVRIRSGCEVFCSRLRSLSRAASTQ